MSSLTLCARVLHLGQNLFSGTVPANIDELWQLRCEWCAAVSSPPPVERCCCGSARRLLSLAGNRFEGSLPASLDNLGAIRCGVCQCAGSRSVVADVAGAVCIHHGAVFLHCEQGALPRRQRLHGHGANVGGGARVCATMVRSAALCRAHAWELGAVVVVVAVVYLSCDVCFMSMCHRCVCLDGNRFEVEVSRSRAALLDCASLC